ncbi:hypothetical protein JCM11251_002342 [Rhodosporidiobolus azoricus]
MSAITGPGVPKPSPWLSSAILTESAGPTLYVSGQCGVDPASGNFIGGTVQDRTTQALKNVEAILKAAGLEVQDLVAATIYLSKYKEDFDSMNKAYVAFFPKGMPLPARTCIGVAALPKGTDVEITCIAAKRPTSKL